MKMLKVLFASIVALSAVSSCAAEPVDASQGNYPYGTCGYAKKNQSPMRSELVAVNNKTKDRVVRVWIDGYKGYANTLTVKAKYKGADFYVPPTDTGFGNITACVKGANPNTGAANMGEYVFMPATEYPGN